MKITKQSRREAKELFRSCVVGGLLEENRVRQAVQQVLQTKPRGYLAILTHFLRLIKLDIERRTALVESAAPLGSDLQTQIQTSLARSYGKGLDISFAQNPELIGGVRIKVGSDVYDGSVQGRLAELQESF
jgi:F-type H+-transporting ATPase subunit delta